MNNVYANKNVLITGAASGIGLAIAENLAARQATLWLTDIQEEKLREVANKLGQRGAQVKIMVVNVAVESEVATMVTWAANGGALDYIFNNAGIAVGGEFDQVDIADHQKVMDIDLAGVMYGSWHAMRRMRTQGSGHIVNTASMAGLMPSPSIGSYCMSKHGVVGLSTALRAEGKDLGIKVTVVCPSFIRTAILTNSKMVVSDRTSLDEAFANARITTADQAAEWILRGVARNKAIVTLPYHAGFVWRLIRLWNGFGQLLATKLIREFRKKYV